MKQIDFEKYYKFLDKKIKLFEDTDETSTMYQEIKNLLQKYERKLKSEEGRIKFILTDEETKRAEEFFKKHREEIPLTTIGGGEKYTICPNGLGHTVSVSLLTNSEITEDITDFESW